MGLGNETGVSLRNAAAPPQSDYKAAANSPPWPCSRALRRRSCSPACWSGTCGGGRLQSAVRNRNRARLMLSGLSRDQLDCIRRVQAPGKACNGSDRELTQMAPCTTGRVRLGHSRLTWTNLEELCHSEPALSVKSLTVDRQRCGTDKYWCSQRADLTCSARRKSFCGKRGHHF